MKFSDSDIDQMLEAIGQTAVIDDGSVAGLTIWCNFLDPQRLVGDFGIEVEATDPVIKVRRSAVEGFLQRGLVVTTGDKDYTVKAFNHKTTGFTSIALEDA